MIGTDICGIAFGWTLDACFTTYARLWLADKHILLDDHNEINFVNTQRQTLVSYVGCIRGVSFSLQLLLSFPATYHAVSKGRGFELCTVEGHPDWKCGVLVEKR